MWLRSVRSYSPARLKLQNPRAFPFPRFIFPRPLSAGWRLAAREPPRMNFPRPPARPLSRPEISKRRREREREANAASVFLFFVESTSSSAKLLISPREEGRLKFSRCFSLLLGKRLSRVHAFLRYRRAEVSISDRASAHRRRAICATPVIPASRRRRVYSSCARRRNNYSDSV